MKYLKQLFFVTLLSVGTTADLLQFLGETTVQLTAKLASFQPTNPKNVPNETSYDFIIVGSGSSGGVLANRLSEISSIKILLLEAGKPGNPLTKVPILAPLLQLTPYNWNDVMERQEDFCMAMTDQKCAWPRGKALGGGTAINYMIYTRGNPKDYDKWAELGNTGWSYNEVLPYFIKSEDCHLGEICSNGYHNTSGYLSTEYAFKTEITDAFLSAAVDLGEKIVDYNSVDYMGFAQIQANQKKGRRHGIDDAFLKPIRNRKNLNIVTSARVIKILIEDNVATGVVYKKGGKTYIAKASKEVILSAGVLSSPQLLMLSGIGPKQHLEELGIPLVKDLPVGELLYDHIAYLGLGFQINQTVEPKTAILDIREYVNWYINGESSLASLGGIEALGYINTGSIPDPSYPDIELIFIGVGSLDADYGLVVGKEIRLRREIYDVAYKPYQYKPCYGLIPMLLHPKSRGFLKLRSTDPFDPPMFYGNYFTDPENEDINTLLAAIRYSQKLSKTPSLQKFHSTMFDIPIPLCTNFTFDSDEYWKCALRSISSTLHHQIGTCKMGPKTDPEAVVDSRLKVYGIEGLRVVDSGVIPTTLSAHTNAPAIMIGEKGADLIKQDHGLI